MRFRGRTKSRVIAIVDATKPNGRVEHIPVDAIPDEELASLMAELEAKQAEAAAIRAKTATLVARAAKMREITEEIKKWPPLDPALFVNSSESQDIERSTASRNSDHADPGLLAADGKERAKAIRAVETGFRWIEYLLPKRIRNEEVGDAAEDIQWILRDPNCPNVRKAIWSKIVSTWFWLAVHAVGRISAAILGKKAG